MNVHPLRLYEVYKLWQFTSAFADNRSTWPTIPPFFGRHYFEGVIRKTPAPPQFSAPPVFVEGGNSGKRSAHFLVPDANAPYV